MGSSARLPRPRTVRSGGVRPLLLALTIAALTACGGEPPETLGGFALGQTQQEVLSLARERGGYQCHVRATRPARAVCEGPAEAGRVTVEVVGDEVVGLLLRLEPDDEAPADAVGRFVRPFGNAAWRDRPVPPRASPPEGYHTLWLDPDSSRSLALVCAGRGLGPPCTAELRQTSPAGVEARLDSLLGIRR